MATEASEVIKMETNELKSAPAMEVDGDVKSESGLKGDGSKGSDGQDGGTENAQNKTPAEESKGGSSSMAGGSVDISKADGVPAVKETNGGEQKSSMCTNEMDTTENLKAETSEGQKSEGGSPDVVGDSVDVSKGDEGQVVKETNGGEQKSDLCTKEVDTTENLKAETSEGQSEGGSPNVAGDSVDVGKGDGVPAVKETNGDEQKSGTCTNEMDTTENLTAETSEGETTKGGSSNVVGDSVDVSKGDEGQVVKETNGGEQKSDLCTKEVDTTENLKAETSEGQSEGGSSDVVGDSVDVSKGDGVPAVKETNGDEQKSGTCTNEMDTAENMKHGSSEGQKIEVTESSSEKTVDQNNVEKTTESSQLETAGETNTENTDNSVSSSSVVQEPKETESKGTESVQESKMDVSEVQPTSADSAPNDQVNKIVMDNADSVVSNDSEKLGGEEEKYCTCETTESTDSEEVDVPEELRQSSTANVDGTEVPTSTSLPVSEQVGSEAGTQIDVTNSVVASKTDSKPTESGGTVATEQASSETQETVSADISKDVGAEQENRMQSDPREADAAEGSEITKPTTEDSQKEEAICPEKTDIEVSEPLSKTEPTAETDKVAPQGQVPQAAETECSENAQEEPMDAENSEPSSQPENTAQVVAVSNASKTQDSVQLEKNTDNKTDVPEKVDAASNEVETFLKDSHPDSVKEATGETGTSESEQKSGANNGEALKTDELKSEVDKGVNLQSDSDPAPEAMPSAPCKVEVASDSTSETPVTKDSDAVESQEAMDTSDSQIVTSTSEKEPMQAESNKVESEDLKSSESTIVQSEDAKAGDVEEAMDTSSSEAVPQSSELTQVVPVNSTASDVGESDTACDLQTNATNKSEITTSPKENTSNSETTASATEEKLPVQLEKSVPPEEDADKTANIEETKSEVLDQPEDVSTLPTSQGLTESALVSTVNASVPSTATEIASKSPAVQSQANKLEDNPFTKKVSEALESYNKILTKEEELALEEASETEVSKEAVSANSDEVQPAEATTAAVENVETTSAAEKAQPTDSPKTSSEDAEATNADQTNQVSKTDGVVAESTTSVTAPDSSVTPTDTGKDTNKIDTEKTDAVDTAESDPDKVEVPGISPEEDVSPPGTTPVSAAAPDPTGTEGTTASEAATSTDAATTSSDTTTESFGQPITVRTHSAGSSYEQDNNDQYNNDQYGSGYSNSDLPWGPQGGGMRPPGFGPFNRPPGHPMMNNPLQYAQQYGQWQQSYQYGPRGPPPGMGPPGMCPPYYNYGPGYQGYQGYGPGYQQMYYNNQYQYQGYYNWPQNTQSTQSYPFYNTSISSYPPQSGFGQMSTPATPTQTSSTQPQRNVITVPLNTNDESKLDTIPLPPDHPQTIARKNLAKLASQPKMTFLQAAANTAKLPIKSTEKPPPLPKEAPLPPLPKEPEKSPISTSLSRGEIAAQLLQKARAKQTSELPPLPESAPPPLPESAPPEDESPAKRRKIEEPADVAPVDTTNHKHLCIGNLPQGTKATALRDMLASFGKVVSCKVAAGKGANAGIFAFVTMDCIADSSMLVASLNGFEFCGARLLVKKLKNPPGGKSK